MRVPLEPRGGQSIYVMIGILVVHMVDFPIVRYNAVVIS